MKCCKILGLLLLTLSARAQNDIEWNGEYLLQLSDFQSAATQIGNVNHYSLHTASMIDFSYHMTNVEFMLTKNFNAKVACTFKRKASALVAPDTLYALDLLAFAKFEFDLSELYARKLRKQLFETKNPFSSTNFYAPLYETIQRQYTERHAMAGKETDVGRNKEKLETLRKEVLLEINELQNFCRTCKPPKKK